MTLRPFYLQNLEDKPPLRLQAPATCQQLALATSELKHIAAGYLGTSRTIETFFRLLKIAGIDKNTPDRQAFWGKYLEAGYINHAWLVLAPAAANFAMSHLGLKSHQFGQLEKCHRIDTQHAVLIMRLSHLLIGEWSHSGKCRFWFQGNLHAPSPFQQHYSRKSLTDYADYIQQHYFSQKGLWQKDAAAWMSAKAHIPAL